MSSKCASKYISWLTWQPAEQRDIAFNFQDVQPRRQEANSYQFSFGYLLATSLIEAVEKLQTLNKIKP